jgi:hypothetical protein
MQYRKGGWIPRVLESMSASRAANQFNAAASNLPPSTGLNALAERFKKRVVSLKYWIQDFRFQTSS